MGKRKELTAKQICGTIFENYYCYGNEPIVDWKVDFNLNDTTENICQVKKVIFLIRICILTIL